MTNKLTIIYAALMVALLAACGSDGGDGPDTPQGGGDDVTVRFALSPRAVSGTRAEGNGVPADPTSKEEKINNWFVVFAQVNDEGKPGEVQKIVSKESVYPAAEADVVSVTLPAADYFVLAFANVSQDKLKEYTSLNIEEGKPLPDYATAQWDVAKFPLNGLSDESDESDSSDKPDKSDILIPMSGMRMITASQHISEVYSIEVVRMVAKLRLEFGNKSDNDITISKITWKPTYTGKVNLFGKYEIKDLTGGKVEYNFLQDDEPVISHDTTNSDAIDLKLYKKGNEGEYVETNTLTIAGNTDANTSHIPDYTKPYAGIYLAESLASAHPTGQCHIEFQIGGETQTYALAPDALKHINRNDYIFIPLSFSDWIVTFEVRFYPPIGGYPAVVKETSESEFYATFKSSGYFEIIPKVRKIGEDKDRILSTLNPGFTPVTVPEGMFDVEPAINEKGAKEIVGSLKTNGSKGHAIFKFTFTDPDGKPTPEKTIHIIRE